MKTIPQHRWSLRARSLASGVVVRWVSLLTAGLAMVPGYAQPVTGHPRIWVRAEDLSRLRSWAQDGNPVYAALTVQVNQAKSDMDSTNAPVPAQDTGSREPEYYATEKYAELFAFMSLISPDQAARDDYARRATNLLMYVMNQAVLGPAAGVPFRDPGFYTEDSNRARTLGEGWPLTVDWVYPYLSAADKATIRQVFLRWAGEIEQFGYHHPEPIGVTNNPVLFADPSQVRWAANNHFNGNNRNLGFLALAFDAADDPNNELRNYLGIATGASLYLVDQLMRTDAAGGLFPEGPEYSPQSLGYVAQLLFALETTGNNDPAVLGRQVQFASNPFWDQVLPGFLHSMSPAQRTNPTFDYLGPLYEPAWYGDDQDYLMPDHINLFAPLALHDRAAGNTQRLQAIRWAQTFIAAGGQDGLPDRVRDSNSFTRGLFYFLLFDPAAPPPQDPRPGLPLTHYSPGLGRLLARTSWDTNAAWFTYKLSWLEIDHQLGDGNQFEFYRRGEWLTKERSGYDLDYGASDNHNTLAVQNDDPGRPPDDYRELLWQRGSQWGYGAGGSPQVLARSFTPASIYLLGDATPLYNSTYNEVTNVQHVSRSILWIEPDHIVVYDRAETFVTNRFKRFWLNLPTNAVVKGNRVRMTTAAGQPLFVTTLLPADAAITVETNPVPPLYGSVANGDPMTYRLRVDAPGNPQNVRFLHVLQGADPGGAADATVLVSSTSGTPFVGVLVKDSVALFSVDLDTPFTNLTYTVPANTKVHRITGLTANAGYGVSAQAQGTNLQVSISTGGAGAYADSGGVLVLTPGAQPLTLLGRSPDGSVRLGFFELVGGTYAIQAATNLMNWSDIGQVPVGSAGSFEFTDTNALTFPMRFYRKALR
ncbi:MAG: hypothetical protein ACYDH9_12550 [Limisphaerales bacterium]